MASGRVSMRFTTDVNQANAGIRKLNAQLRNQQKEIQRLKDASKENSTAQDRSLVNLTRNISAAALAYQGLNKIISTGNQLLTERNDLQQEAARIAAPIGREFSQLAYQLGPISDVQWKEMTAFAREQAKVAKVSPEKAIQFTGAVATALGGEGYDDQEWLRRTREVVRAGLPMARSYEGTQIGLLLAGLTTMGFTGEEAVGQIIATQKAVHSVDIAAQSYIMRSLVAGRMFNLEQFKDLPAERQKQISQEMMAITAGFTQYMKSKGMEMPATAAAGAILTMYERYGPALEGKSPMEALDWMVETGVWRELDLKDVRGESIAKPGTLDLFRGGGLRRMVDAIYEDMRETTAEAGRKVIERAAEGTPEIMVYTQEQERKAVEAVDRGLKSGPRATIQEQIKSFATTFDDTMAERAAMMAAEAPEYFRGFPDDPETQRLRFMSYARKLAYSRREPWMSLAGPDITGSGLFTGQGTMTRAQRLYGTNPQMLAAFRRGEDLEIFEDFTPEEITSFRRILANIDKQQEVKEQEKLPAPGADAGVKESNRSLKASVEMKGAANSRGRQTEPD